MSAQEIYTRLLVSGNGEHLILAELFKLVFNRNLKPTEWGFLRKLIKLYGAELVYWSMLNSAGISNTDNPLPYVMKVCVGTLKRETIFTGSDKASLSRQTQALLNEMTCDALPDWESILNASD